jgi:hypothetical protein
MKNWTKLRSLTFWAEWMHALDESPPLQMPRGVQFKLGRTREGGGTPKDRLGCTEVTVGKIPNDDLELAGCCAAPIKLLII